MFIVISETMAKNGGICPICGHFFKPNGLGPKRGKFITALLSLLPSTQILSYGANYHDWYYHIGKVDNKYDSEWFREIADGIFYRKNEEIIKEKAPFYLRPYLRLMNKRNYFFVRKFGKSYFNKFGCKQKPMD